MGDFANAVDTYWSTGTTAEGHYQRGLAFFDAAQSTTYGSRTAMYKAIAAEVAEAAPDYERPFKYPTVAQYVASYQLFLDHSVHSDKELYAVVHKAYAASMGVSRIKEIISDPHYTLGQMIDKLNKLERPRAKKSKKEMDLATAVNALNQIIDHTWTDSEKETLYELTVSLAMKCLESD